MPVEQGGRGFVSFVSIYMVRFFLYFLPLVENPRLVHLTINGCLVCGRKNEDAYAKSY
jgi:hypothetical protein